MQLLLAKIFFRSSALIKYSGLAVLSLANRFAIQRVATSLLMGAPTVLLNWRAESMEDVVPVSTFAEVADGETVSFCSVHEPDTIAIAEK